MSEPALNERSESIEAPKSAPDVSAEIVFPEGIIGVPRAKRFLLLQRDDSAIHCLSCLDIKGFSLPVVDPFLAEPSYTPRLGPWISEALGTDGSDPILMLAIANVESGAAVANLRAPLVINARRQRGIQVILDDARYALRAPVRTGRTDGQGPGS